MPATCPICGRDLFICQLCNSELLSILAALVDRSSCIAHFCSTECMHQSLIQMDGKTIENHPPIAIDLCDMRLNNRSSSNLLRFLAG